MTRKTPDWIALNAFVDGELSPQDAAPVAHAIEADAALAEQFALLHQLKGGIAHALPPAPADLLAAPATGPGAWRRGIGLVAACAVAASLAATILFWPEPSGLTVRDAFVASTRDYHARWISADTTGPAVPTPAVLDALTNFGRLPVLPDLEPSGLLIALAEVHDFAGNRVLQVGYRGYHGCHLSLFVWSGAPLRPGPLTRHDPLERSHAWQAGDLSYLLLALGMAPSRFELIAEKVEDATRGYRPLDEHEREQLAANRRQSARCQV